MPTLQIRVSPELHERFLAECAKRDVKPSELGREAIERLTDGMAATPLDRSGLAARIAGLPARRMPSIRGFAAVGGETLEREGARPK